MMACIRSLSIVDDGSTWTTTELSYNNLKHVHRPRPAIADRIHNNKLLATTDYAVYSINVFTIPHIPNWYNLVKTKYVQF